MSQFDPLLQILQQSIENPGLAPTARWNFPAAAGTPVGSPGGVGTAASVTYSFMLAVPSYDSPADHPNFRVFDAAITTAARQALAAWSAVCNLNFIEVADTGAGGAIRFGRNDMADGGYAYFPSYAYSSVNGILQPGPTVANFSGDIYLANYPQNDAVAAGQYGYDTLVHEIGHAIGLKHPFEGAFTLPAEADTLAYTIMSYTPPANAGTVTVTGTASSYFSTTETLYPSGPMLYDIAAAQYLYGANTSHASGNDSYGWATNARFFETIWDAGGTDTIDAGNQTLRCIIDLVAGHFSSIGLRQTVAERRLEIPAFAGQAPTPSYDGHNNLAIAFGAVIENAIGGSNDDLLTGNAVANQLDGAAGADTLDGGAGADTLAGGLGNDLYRADAQGDVIVEAAGEGTDTVIATAGFYLYANVETLTLATGAGGIFGVGNELANTLTGNEAGNLLIAGDGADTADGGAGADTLFGTGGNDSLQGGTGADYLFGGEGADTLSGDADADVLYGEAGNDNLLGGAAIDYLIAGDGNDTLDGGIDADALFGEAGDDSLTGGNDFVFDQLVGGEGADTLDGDSGFGDYDYLYGQGGDDSYFVDTPNDLVFEFAGEGTDTVFAAIVGAGYYLYGGIENLTLLGNTPFGVGNELANGLVGNAIGNYLLGGEGNDTLNGKAGNDVLFGEAGADRFVFERGTGGDLIGDFAPGTDKIQLKSLGFASFADVLAASGENGGTAFIDFGLGDFVVIAGVARASLSAGDFLFG